MSYLVAARSKRSTQRTSSRGSSASTSKQRDRKNIRATNIVSILKRYLFVAASIPFFLRNTVQQEKVARRCRFGERFDRRATHDAPSLHHAQFMPTLNGLRAMRAEFFQHSQNLALNLNNSAAVLPHRYLSRIKYMRKVGQIS